MVTSRISDRMLVGSQLTVALFSNLIIFYSITITILIHIVWYWLNTEIEILYSHKKSSILSNVTLGRIVIRSQLTLTVFSNLVIFPYITINKRILINCHFDRQKYIWILFPSSFLIKQYFFPKFPGINQNKYFLIFIATYEHNTTKSHRRMRR